VQDARDLEASDRIAAVTGILRAVWQSCNVQALANATKDMGLTGMDRDGPGPGFKSDHLCQAVPSSAKQCQRLQDDPGVKMCEGVQNGANLNGHGMY
jgi:hypothetical protein